jgi:hypothetical protein
MPRELTKEIEMLLEITTHPAKSDLWAICCDANQLKIGAFQQLGYEKTATRIEQGDVQFVLQALVAIALERSEEEQR